MAVRYSREQVLERLCSRMEAGKAIFMFGAGSGLSAKCAERGGADLIAVYSMAVLRMRGIPGAAAMLPFFDSNAVTLDAAEQILPLIKETPCLMGIAAQDPKIEIERLLDKAQLLGFSGIVNEPSVGDYPQSYQKDLGRMGLGYEREAEAIERANIRGMFTLGWCRNELETAMMARAGADIIGAMVLPAAGEDPNIPMGEALERVRRITEAAVSARDDIMIITHGSPFMDPNTARISIQNTAAVGYASGSSGERLPAERAILEAVTQFRDISIN